MCGKWVTAEKEACMCSSSSKQCIPAYNIEEQSTNQAHLQLQPHHHYLYHPDKIILAEQADLISPPEREETLLPPISSTTYLPTYLV